MAPRIAFLLSLAATACGGTSGIYDEGWGAGGGLDAETGGERSVGGGGQAGRTGSGGTATAGTGGRAVGGASGGSPSLAGASGAVSGGSAGTAGQGGGTAGSAGQGGTTGGVSGAPSSGGGAQGGASSGGQAAGGASSTAAQVLAVGTASHVVPTGTFSLSITHQVNLASGTVCSPAEGVRLDDATPSTAGPVFQESDATAAADCLAQAGSEFLYRITFRDSTSGQISNSQGIYAISPELTPALIAQWTSLRTTASIVTESGQKIVRFTVEFLGE